MAAAGNSTTGQDADRSETLASASAFLWFNEQRDMRTRTMTLPLELKGAIAALRARRGPRCDSRAWDRLLPAIQPTIRAIARHDYRLSGADSDDVCQLVCLRVFQRVRQLREPAALLGWLRSLTRRVIVDYLRQRRETLSLESLRREPDSAADHHGPGASWLERLSFRLDLEKAIRNLPEKYRLPVWLHVVEGAPQEEVSQRLGRPRSTIATQVQRGLNRLRQALAPPLEVG